MAQVMKNVTIRVTPDFHRELKAFLAIRGISIQEYVEELIKIDMEKQKKGENKTK